LFSPTFFASTYAIFLAAIPFFYKRFAVLCHHHFEFILLLVDSYLGMFLNNPAYLLGVNIVLALGLVTLGTFLRNDFLNWYE
tara:strand:+ start:1532 stop:1777 length:246 start_codon:yes stop_codon:yes gene_type:complete